MNASTPPPRANIELKARYPDRVGAEETCERLGARFVHTETQTDTYFSAPNYRMKIRESSLGDHYIIWYHRPDVPGSRKSSYRLRPVEDPAAARTVFAGLNVKAVVRKERTLYMLANVRIHLDRVDGVGDCLEFEAVLEDGADEAEAHAQVEYLRQEFEIRDEDLLSVSYADLVGAPA